MPISRGACRDRGAPEALGVHVRGRTDCHARRHRIAAESGRDFQRLRALMPSRLTRIGAAAIAGLLLAPAARALQEHLPTPHRHADGEARQPGRENARVCKNRQRRLREGLRQLSRPEWPGQRAAGRGDGRYGGRPSNLTDSEWQHGSSDGEIFRSATASAPTSTCRFSLES